MCKRFCTVLLAAGILTLLIGVRPTRVGANDKADKPLPPFADWRVVESFTCEGSAFDHSWGHENKPWIWGDTQHVDTADYRFELKSGRGDSTWNVANCQVSGTRTYTSRGGTPFRRSDHYWNAAFSGSPIHGGSLSLDFDTGKWEVLTPNSTTQPYRLIGRYHIEENRGDRWATDDSEINDPGTDVQGLFIDGALAPGTKPGVLTGSSVRDDGNASHGSHRVCRVVMWPTFRDVECIVEIEGYEKWLPLAVVGSPTSPGSRLLVKATLQPKGADIRSPLHAVRFRFELDDTSREPGIAMNSPRFGNDGSWVPDKDPNPDMKLSTRGLDGELSNEDQKAVMKPINSSTGHDFAMVAVESYDFGAWSNLHVICELDDGREIPGLIKLKNGPTADITLPKRSNGSKIADVWRDKYKLGPNDAEDSDKDPVGDGNLGDGYSNYEEYRGFVVDGHHVRTDPLKKDLFIRNRIGAAAEPGLTLFANLTGLAVHSKLQESEIPETRIININRTNASPRSSQEPQHGLIMVYQMSGDASRADMRDDATGRPKNVETVQILRSLAPGGRESSSSFTASDEVELDSTIAHELCHSIGVHHHGDSDIGRVAWGRVERTIAGKKTAWFEERMMIPLQSGGYRVSSIPGLHIRIFTSLTTELLPTLGSPYDHPQTLWVGVYGGQHSGSDACIMRYDCSQAYVLPDRPRDRFISPGEPTGRGICNSAAGEGINASTKDPPRYSDATLGDCVHQFAVRDDAPEPSPPKSK
jgi:hypothetical protein